MKELEAELAMVSSLSTGAAPAIARALRSATEEQPGLPEPLGEKAVRRLRATVHS